MTSLYDVGLRVHNVGRRLMRIPDRELSSSQLQKLNDGLALLEEVFPRQEQTKQGHLSELNWAMLEDAYRHDRVGRPEDYSVPYASWYSSIYKMKRWGILENLGTDGPYKVYSITESWWPRIEHDLQVRWGET